MVAAAATTSSPSSTSPPASLLCTPQPPQPAVSPVAHPTPHSPSPATTHLRRPIRGAIDDAQHVPVFASLRFAAPSSSPLPGFSTSAPATFCGFVNSKTLEVQPSSGEDKVVVLSTTKNKTKKLIPS